MIRRENGGGPEPATRCIDAEAGGEWRKGAVSVEMGIVVAVEIDPDADTGNDPEQSRRRTPMKLPCLSLVFVTAGLCVGRCMAMPKNLVGDATVSASSMASPTPDGKYGVLRLCDGAKGTHWASQSGYEVPQWVRIEWGQPVRLDTVVIDIFCREGAHIYAPWKAFDVRLSTGVELSRELDLQAPEFVIVRFERAQEAEWVEVRITAVHERKTYLGLNEIGVYLDPERRIRPQRVPAAAKPADEVLVSARPQHPTVYVTADDVARARRNAVATDWGKTTAAGIVSQADGWLEHDDEHWLRFLPQPGACYAYGFTGCPICGASFGTWGGARCRWDLPGKATCAKGHVLPDDAHADDGTGYVGADGRSHYFLGIWHAWVTEQWTRNALPSLAHAYALTGDERYAERAAFLFDALASIYAESTSGSWDYPSRPPSGRFARPWYQTARNLVVFVDAYDLIYASKALDKASLRPRLEATFPAGPTPQQRAVGTKDVNGKSWEGMTRRQNVDLNLMRDSARYCYGKTFAGKLHNGHADYMRGALAVGALLGIPEYVYNAVESPYSIYAMLANNCDRDGRYYETALGYALHARNLYLTFVEPLRNWRCAKYPEGVDLFADPRMRSFYHLPDLVVQTAGHSPNFGDAGPDNQIRHQRAVPHSATDYAYAERLYAGCSGSARDEFGRILTFLAGGDVAQARAQSNLQRWLLYHADPVPSDTPADLPPDFIRRVFGSWLLGQKGIGILRDGREADAQAALLRFGPSLNHGDLDDLGLIYYGKGWQLAYEIGYGLGSTHTQVGWGSQTVSHALVTVNEVSQSSRGSADANAVRGGSGGSIYLFAHLPSVKIMEADSPLSYADQGVSQYRRTVVLVGAGSDQYLVDFFRVRGGRQHDYGIGVQTQEVVLHGIGLGEEEDGSLAGVEHAWGEKIGLDGDVTGHPNKPYWNPPPGSGYGFFYDARRGRTGNAFCTEFVLGGRNDARFRLHALPEAEREVILAKAPGLYPRHRKATYLILRNRDAGDEETTSAFACVMEPYARTSREDGGRGSAELWGMLKGSRGEVKHKPTLDVVLLLGTGVGDYVEFSTELAQAGDYEVAARILQAPSYGTVSLQVDGEQVGEPFNACHTSIHGPVRVSFGRTGLTAGAHTFRFRMEDSPAHFVGVSALIVRPWDGIAQEEAAAPHPILSRVERVPVSGQGGDVAPVGVHTFRGSRDEYVFSAGPDDSVHRAETAAGTVSWRGALVFLACRDGEVEALATHGAWEVRVGSKRYGPEVGVLTTRVTRLDYEERWVEVDFALPEDLQDACVTFSNPRYSRNTGYRIYGTRRTASGSRIDLGSQAMLLGQGRVHHIASEEKLFSDIPHDYACTRLGGADSRFFDGKLVTNGNGGSTHLQQVLFATPMELRVDSTEAFSEGDTLFYYDVQVGDTVTIPTAWEGGR